MNSSNYDDVIAKLNRGEFVDFTYKEGNYYTGDDLIFTDKNGIKWRTQGYYYPETNTFAPLVSYENINYDQIVYLLKAGLIVNSWLYKSQDKYKDPHDDVIPGNVWMIFLDKYGTKWKGQVVYDTETNQVLRPISNSKLIKVQVSYYDRDEKNFNSIYMGESEHFDDIVGGDDIVIPMNKIRVEFTHFLPKTYIVEFVSKDPRGFKRREVVEMIMKQYDQYENDDINEYDIEGPFYGLIQKDGNLFEIDGF